MKKLLAAILAVLMVFTLAACGGGEKTDGGENVESGDKLQAKYESMTAEELI